MHDEPSGSWVGQRAIRAEDGRLLRGAGEFVADYTEPGMLHAMLLRSPVASGRLVRVAVEKARAVPGVVAVFTGEDVAASGLGGIPWEICPPGLESKARFSGDPQVAPPQPLMAVSNVRYVGEPLALVLGETALAAADGAEAINLEIEPSKPVTNIADALDAPLFTYRCGNADAVDRAMIAAPLVISLETHIPRLVAAPVETRGYLARYDVASRHWTLIAAAGKPHPLRDAIARHILHVDPKCIHLIARDIGGGFGAKNVMYAEPALCLWAAQLVRRPVRWVGSRLESFLSDTQGRDHAISAKLALDADGRFLALSYDASINLGAYLGPRGVSPCLNGIRVLTGPYRIEAARAHVRGVFTNTVPTCPYRGAGAPETSFVVERLIDMAARRLEIDPAELRRRNLLCPEHLPWRSPVNVEMHSVNFPAVLDQALQRSAWQKHRKRENGALKRGRGIAFTIEGYEATFSEAAEMVLDYEGRVEIRIGTKSAGQSHETTYAQLAADALQLPPDRVKVLQGDTALVARGNGTGASRSLTVGGSAILMAAAALMDAARSAAATCLQCSPAELTYCAGRFERSGALSGSISLADIADATPERQLHVVHSFQPSRFTFPGGCHIAIVDVDLETGAVHLVEYHAVYDAGVAVNPAVVEGQLQGGIVQGIGAALMEHMVFDAESGQPVSASFQDYAIPRAHNLCDIDIGLHGTRCASNLVGAKPVGEAGTVAAPPAIINAIIDALDLPALDHLDLPATAERIWRAIHLARN